MQKAGLDPIDLVVVNLYPFRETVARGAPFEEVIENIDIGGPAMIRSAAKNHERVAVIVDPADYAPVLAEIDADGEVSAATRFRAGAQGLRAHGRLRRRDRLAPRADVDARGAAGRLSRGAGDLRDAGARAALRREPAPEGGVLRRRGAPGPSLARAEVLQGKELSYNNLLDLDAAMRLCAEFAEPAAAIIKHNTPCGAAICRGGRRRGLPPRARDRSGLGLRRHRGGQPPRRRRARRASCRETFLECVIAPAFAPEALALLAAKKNLRLLAAEIGRDAAGAVELRSVAGGFLVQTRDRDTAAAADGKVASKRAPTAAELRDLDFAWRVCKHVKSNAIVFAADGRTLGIGAGQMSRVDSVRIAVSKARAPLGRLGGRLRRLLPVPRRRRRGGQGGRARRSSSRAARCATPSRSPPPTSTGWRW